MANYGIGGFYESHQDPMFVYKEPDFLVHSVQETNPAYVTGDRLGTFMLYLSEVRIKRFFWLKDLGTIIFYLLQKSKSHSENRDAGGSSQK